MLTEIEAAADFLSQYLPTVELQTSFKEQLIVTLKSKYEGHWQKDQPIQGNAYRAINVISSQLDQVLRTVMKEIQLDNPHIYFPEDIVIWVDPSNVSYRIGDFGFVTNIYENRPKVTLRSPDRPSDPPIELGKTRVFRPASPPRTPSPSAPVRRRH